MELKDYLNVVRKYLWLLVFVVVISTVATFLFSYLVPESFDASSTIYITKKQNTNELGYQYDSYYAIQASTLYADYITAWLKDPSVVVQIYNNAKLNLPTQKIKDLSKIITAKKILPAGITITLNDENEAIVRNLIDNTVSVIKNKNANWEQNISNKDFVLNVDEPLVIKHEKSLLTDSLIGLISGVIIGLGLVFLVDYFKK